MSKVDGPRAIRDARYAAYRASLAAAAPASAPAAPVRAATVPAVTPAAKAPAAALTLVTPESVIESPGVGQLFTDPATGDAEPELCGHRNMSGKSCSRSSGHSEKNHRYA